MKKGFTLIELLLTIAIVGVLAAVVILTLNPAELLRQSRDSNRTSDLNTLKNAINLYITDLGANADLGAANTCYALPSSSIACASRFAGGGSPVMIATENINGTGWIPVNFMRMSSEAPISALPRDPINNTTYFYAYKPDQAAMVFEINAKMESAKYANGGDGDIESTDGGDNNNLFESGTSFTL